MPEITPIELAKETVITQVTQTPSAKLAASKATAPQEIALPEPKVEDVPRETKEEEKPPIKRDDDGKFAALSKREKELVRRDRELKERERQLAEKYKPFEEATQLAPQSKVQALQRLGINYDDLVAEQLGLSNLTPEQIAEKKAAEIVEEKLRVFQEQQKQLALEQQQKTYAQALQQITSEVKQACDPDKFPIVNNIKGFDTVTSLIEQTYHQTGEILSREDALAQYEKFLEDELGTLVNQEKIKLKLIKNEPQKQADTQPPQAQTPPKTLTHKTTTAPTNPENRPKTYEEKKRYILEKYSNS